MATYEEIFKAIKNEEWIMNYLNQSNLNDFEKHELVRSIIRVVKEKDRRPRRRPEEIDTAPHSYVVIDTETTGLYSDDEFIELSALKIEKDKIVDSFDNFVSPSKKELSLNVSYLTGITEADINGAPKLEELLPKFKEFIGDFPIVGHHIIGFDLPRFRKVGLSFENNSIFDTEYLAREAHLPIKNCTLDTLKEYYGIDYLSHNSLKDCQSTNEVYQHLIHKDYASVKAEKASNSFLQDKKICISGTFQAISRNDMKRLVQKYGGKVVGSVSKNTDIFIDGKQIAHNLVDGNHSNKELSAMEYVKNGKLKIWKENEIVKKLKEAGENIA